MSTIRLKKGFDLHLLGAIQGNDIAFTSPARSVAIVPDDFHGVIPRMEKKEGEHVIAGEPLYHDKNDEDIKVVAPVSGTIKEIRRGERRHIDAIIIAPDNDGQAVKHDTGGDAVKTLKAAGLWVMLRQRPYDVVPYTDVRPRNVFVTAFDSAPLAPDLDVVLGDKRQFIGRGVEVLKSLTDGNVCIGTREGQAFDAPGAQVNTFVGPHPAGNAGVQAANTIPVNKGEVVWTLDIVTLARIGELFTTGMVSHDTVVAIDGEMVQQPGYVKTVMGADLETVLKNQLTNVARSRIISGNVLTGVKVNVDQWLRAPYRHITIIPENNKPDEFMGWASFNPNRFSIYRTFTTWLRGLKKPVSMDSRIKGGERAIVRTGEYDAMLPMDIHAEFLIKAIISGDIDKMEQLGVYEIAPEDFALAEFADTSKLELQRIVRQGLDKLRAEMS
ncbi:MAG: Na(+)-translocating NADH-quinone reductase subunit A [Muribaculaceae bacterium]|jgi:Na+-transporting NADH:ubiquinone oxidoreductase subunit A|nr:Na(+)-translocating NADH-quinone reductase subunit A [Muribaculaceae bacterium]